MGVCLRWAPLQAFWIGCLAPQSCLGLQGTRGFACWTQRLQLLPRSEPRRFQQWFGAAGCAMPLMGSAELLCTCGMLIVGGAVRKCVQASGASGNPQGTKHSNSLDCLGSVRRMLSRLELGLQEVNSDAGSKYAVPLRSALLKPRTARAQVTLGTPNNLVLDGPLRVTILRGL